MQGVISLSSNYHQISHWCTYRGKSFEDDNKLTKVQGLGCRSLGPELGISSTPVSIVDHIRFQLEHVLPTWIRTSGSFVRGDHSTVIPFSRGHAFTSSSLRGHAFTSSVPRIHALTFSDPLGHALTSWTALGSSAPRGHETSSSGPSLVVARTAQWRSR